MKTVFRLEKTLSDELTKGTYVIAKRSKRPELGDYVICKEPEGLECRLWNPDLEGVIGVAIAIEKPVV